MPNFTEEQVIELAKQRYGKPISIDFLQDAMKEETIEDAVETLLVDSYYCDMGK